LAKLIELQISCQTLFRQIKHVADLFCMIAAQAAEQVNPMAADTAFAPKSKRVGHFCPALLKGSPARTKPGTGKSV
jgi:hypothetical protein